MSGPWEKYADQPGLTAESADEEFKRKVEELKAQYGKNTEGVNVLSPTGKDTTKVEAFGQEFDVPTFFTSPAGAALGAAGATFAAIGAYQVGKKGAQIGKNVVNSIADRMLNKPVEIDRTVDIPLDTRPIQTEKPPVSPYTQAEQEMLQRSAQNAAAKAQEAELKRLQAQSAVPGAAAPVAAPAPVQPPATPTVTQAVEAGVSPTQALQVEVAKQIDATPTEPPKNKGGRPRKDAVKPPVPESEVGLTKQQIGLKRHLESFYGGGDIGAQSYEQVKNILGYTPAYPPGQGGGLQPEETGKILQYRKENIAGPKVNLTHDMKKLMKSGALGALAALPGFADAAQKKDYGKMADIASDFLVLPFAQSSEAGMPKAQEESIIASKFKEAQKLGSPYRSVPPPR